MLQVARLESQVIRYKSAAETSEKVEDELKVEKRKLQREVGDTLVTMPFEKFCVLTCVDFLQRFCSFAVT